MLLQAVLTWTATCGAVTQAGDWTAPLTPGTCQVVASKDGKTSTSSFQVVPAFTLRGSAFGPYHVPTDSLGKAGFSYSGGQVNGYAPGLLADLAKVRSARGRVMISLLRSKTKDAAGHLSVAAARADLASWPDISSYIADGTVAGIVVSDDITSAAIWGGEEPPKARLDSLALAVKQRWSLAKTLIRATPSELGGYTWKWLDAAWAQFNGPFRNGTPQAYRDANVAGAKALKLGLVLGLNVLDGGCGSPTTACLAGVPGSSIWGTYISAPTVRRYQMSAAEVYAYGKVFLEEPYNCGLFTWQWGPAWDESGRTASQVAGIQGFDLRSDVRASNAKLRTLADQQPGHVCDYP